MGYFYFLTKYALVELKMFTYSVRIILEVKNQGPQWSYDLFKNAQWVIGKVGTFQDLCFECSILHIQIFKNFPKL